MPAAFGLPALFLPDNSGPGHGQRPARLTGYNLQRTGETMRGVKTISRKLGYGTAPMPEHDPHAGEGNCPLCGTYGPLSPRTGWCYDTACKERAREALRAEARDAPEGILPGRYYRAGEIELINLVPFETRGEPESPIKHPDMCVKDCDTWARPGDTLCPEHRLEANAQRHEARRRQREGKARKQKGRSINRIRGLEKLKG